MLRRAALACLLVFVAGGACLAQEKPQTGILFREVQVSGTTYRYEVFVPSTWTPQKKWPVILFLHGAGHRGTYAPGATESLLAARFQSYHQQNQAVVVLPRCAREHWWTDPEMEALALQALEQAIAEFNGDRTRLYLTGLSMGGFGAWSLAARYPGKFAAIAPVCGGIRGATVVPVPAVSDATDPYADVARRIGRTPVWIFHGARDDVIDVNESRRMAQALEAAGGDVRYTEYPGVGHNSWENAYRDPEFLSWLFSRRLNAAPDSKR